MKRYRLHFLVWALYILYETVVIGLFFGAFGNFLTYAVHYFCIICLFYTHTFYGLPWSLKKNTGAIWKMPLVIATEATVFIGASYGMDVLLNSFHVNSIANHFQLDYQYCLKTLYRGGYFIAYSTGYYFILRYINEKKKTDELEKQRLNDIIYRQKTEQELSQAQNAFLKAQINPHFLFNTLDFIYHNVVASSPVAADAIITLSEMMRYAIDSDKMGEYVLLADEIDQVENLLYLNQMRRNHNLNFSLRYDEQIRNIKLIPLVLLTLVENIFKHGNLGDPEHEAVVNMYLTGDTFFMETSNLINKRIATTSNNKGLDNIEQRLKFAYGDGVQFTHKADIADYFKVVVKIPVAQLKALGGSSKFLKDAGKELLHEPVGLQKIAG
ncbi:MAG: histidine kinase [Bacteroidota bacterium]|nr:histidine kinase [Bacteroidota bacterium]